MGFSAFQFFFPFHNFYSHVFLSKKIICMESNYYQVPLPFIATLRIFSAQKCCQNLTFLFRGKVGYSAICSISTIFSIILNGILGKIYNL